MTLNHYFGEDSTGVPVSISVSVPPGLFGLVIAATWEITPLATCVPMLTWVEGVSPNFPFRIFGVEGLSAIAVNVAASLDSHFCNAGSAGGTSIDPTAQNLSLPWYPFQGDVTVQLGDFVMAGTTGFGYSHIVVMFVTESELLNDR
jgi:hypothetical protein